jgi:peroxiredoxin
MVMNISRRRFGEVLGALGAFGAFGGAAALDLLAPPRAQSRIGGRPPAFTLPAAVGGPSSEDFRMGDHLGRRPVVILFWATWCVPCQQELPFYQSLYERYRDRGLRVCAISMDDARTVTRAGPAARRLGVTYDVVTDLDTRVTTQLNPRRSAPFSIWVDRSGRIVWEREGFAPAEQQAIAQGIAQLVGA